MSCMVHHMLGNLLCLFLQKFAHKLRQSYTCRQPAPAPISAPCNLALEACYGVLQLELLMSGVPLSCLLVEGMQMI